MPVSLSVVDALVVDVEKDWIVVEIELFGEPKLYRFSITDLTQNEDTGVIGLREGAIGEPINESDPQIVTEHRPQYLC